MRLILTASVAMAIACVVGTQHAAAQFPGGPQPGGSQRPAFSPYLNLNRAGTSPAVNYYGIVRPQFQALSTFQSLEQQTAANRQAITDTGNAATGLPNTGHQIAFLNTAGYFMNMNPNPNQGFGGGQSGTSFGGGLSGNGGIRTNNNWNNSLSRPRGGR